MMKVMALLLILVLILVMVSPPSSPLKPGSPLELLKIPLDLQLPLLVIPPRKLPRRLTRRKLLCLLPYQHQELPLRLLPLLHPPASKPTPLYRD